MENIPNSRLQMRTLMLWNDVAFLSITRSVFNQLYVTPRMVNTSAAAVAMIQRKSSRSSLSTGGKSTIFRNF